MCACLYVCVSLSVCLYVCLSVCACICLGLCMCVCHIFSSVVRIHGRTLFITLGQREPKKVRCSRCFQSFEICWCFLRGGGKGNGREGGRRGERRGGRNGRGTRRRGGSGG